MFRFSMDRDVRQAANGDELATAGITPDEDWKRRLEGEGTHREGEHYYRAENESPSTLAKAIEYVQGIMLHPPRRVWIEDEAHEVSDEDVRGARKPEI